MSSPADQSPSPQPSQSADKQKKVTLNLLVMPSAKAGLDELADRLGYGSKSALIEAIALGYLRIQGDELDDGVKDSLAEVAELIGKAIAILGKLLGRKI
jgi:hypothetical protein